MHSIRFLCLWVQVAVVQSSLPMDYDISMKTINATTADMCGLLKAYAKHPSPCTSREPVLAARALSGGFCYATVLTAGWFRGAVVNPIMTVLFRSDPKKNLPIIVGSNSGGTMFYVRYLVLWNYPSATKWTYPCYLLYVHYQSMCFFHSQLGGVAAVCQAEAYNVMLAATGAVYSVLMLFYGGPNGVLSTYAYVYFPYESSLPTTVAQKRSISVFAMDYVPWCVGLRQPMNWQIAHSIVNPLEASNGVQPYNYGYDTWLTRGMPLYQYKRQYGWALYPEWYHNLSTASITAQSANVQSGLNMAAFGFAGKTWDGLTMGSPLGVMLKVTGMIITLVLVRKMMKKHTVLRTANAPLCETAGCPLMDGGFTDNGPLTPVFSYSSFYPEFMQPTKYTLVGPASSFGMYQFFLGQGPLPLWNGMGGNLNLCPFTQVNICGMITNLRKMIVGIMPKAVNQKYYMVTNAYGAYMPENQIMVSFCGDPLAYDMFAGDCGISSFCTFRAIVTPSGKMRIQFTPNIYVVVLSIVYLAQTPLSKIFVETYIPATMTKLKYYENMHQWFPNFSTIALNKGGMGFTLSAGHALMDYLTFLGTRMAPELIDSEQQARYILQGNPGLCEFQEYKAIAKANEEVTRFLMNQAQKSNLNLQNPLEQE